MYNKIVTNLNTRMAAYTSSLQPTGDEVAIAWLISEIEQLKEMLVQVQPYIAKNISLYIFVESALARLALEEEEVDK